MTTKYTFGNEKEFHFINEFKNNSYGFNHISTLYAKNGTVLAVAKISYINRTWEPYEFYSSMNSAINKRVHEVYCEHKDKFMDAHGFKKLTASRKKDLIKELFNSEDIKQLDDIYNAVNKCSGGVSYIEGFHKHEIIAA